MKFTKFYFIDMLRHPSPDVMRQRLIVESEQWEIEHRSQAESYAAQAAISSANADMYAARRARLMRELGANKAEDNGLS